MHRHGILFDSLLCIAAGSIHTSLGIRQNRSLMSVDEGVFSDEKETDWVGHLLGGRQVSRAVFMLANNRHSLCLSLCRSKQSVKHFQATLTEKGVKFGGKDFPTAEGFADHFRINVIIGDESGSKLFSLQCKESCSIFVLTRDCRRMPSSVSTRDNRIW